MNNFQEKDNFDQLARFAKESLGEELEEKSSTSCCGIVYCRTVADTKLVAQQLITRGVTCKAFYAGLQVGTIIK